MKSLKKLIRKALAAKNLEAAKNTSVIEEVKLETNEARAQAVKAELIYHAKGYKLNPLRRSDPFHNPLARIGVGLFDDNRMNSLNMEFLKTCRDSARLIILEEHLPILEKFFENRQKIDDKLGDFYKTLSFENFLLRLFNHRYREIYIDGRAVVSRLDDYDFNFSVHNFELGRQFIQYVGGPRDTKGFYKKYLTLEEMTLSFLVLPQATSVVLGTGSRSVYWNIKDEFNKSINLASFSYPAAAEFRDMLTSHLDFLFICKPVNGYYPDELTRLKKISNNKPLLDVAEKIYGSHRVFEDEKVDLKWWYTVLPKQPDEQKQKSYFRTTYILSQSNVEAEWQLCKYKNGKFVCEIDINTIPNLQITLNELPKIPVESINREDINKLFFPLSAYHTLNASEKNKEYAVVHADNIPYYLHKESYIKRTKHMLKQVLLAADHAMSEMQLGTTFQLKGLGLGAFGFTNIKSKQLLEGLYIISLKQVLSEIKLNYIKCVNLINLPATLYGVKVHEPIYIEGVKVMLMNMDPTSNEHKHVIGDIGGTVFCGDSGSQVGNEGNVGLPRDSSDDPATQYSLFDPQILDPQFNNRLKNPSCIAIINNENKLVNWHDYQKSIAEEKVENTSSPSLL